MSFLSCNGQWVSTKSLFRVGGYLFSWTSWIDPTKVFVKIMYPWVWEPFKVTLFPKYGTQVGSRGRSVERRRVRPWDYCSVLKTGALSGRGRSAGQAGDGLPRENCAREGRLIDQSELHPASQNCNSKKVSSLGSWLQSHFKVNTVE